MVPFYNVSNHRFTHHLQMVMLLGILYIISIKCRLNEYNTTLKSLKTRRDLLYSKLSEVLVAKV